MHELTCKILPKVLVGKLPMVNNEDDIDKIITDWLKEKKEEIIKEARFGAGQYCITSEEADEILGLKEKTLGDKFRDFHNDQSQYPDMDGLAQIAERHFKGD